MPVYEFECESCEIIFETVLGINDLHIGECPACDKITNKRVFSPFTVINKTPNTLGSLSDKRRSEMGQYNYDDTLTKMATERKTEFKGKLPDGCSQVEPTKDRPWWRKDRTTPDYSLLKMSPQQTTKYIMENKKPPGLE